MSKRWVKRGCERQDLVDKLASALNIDSVLSTLLVQRGITLFPEARDFFRPSLDNLHDPFLIKDMDVAIERIEKAIENNERILVYGDYDVDGTTSVALVYSFLNQFYRNIDFYIPDRFTEGYGVSFESIDYASKNNIGLIIALDCGVKANNQVDYAIEKGIDFIIVDHHRPGDELPQAVAVVDPKRVDCPYPYKELSGCGLGFKLAQAYYQKHRMPFDELERFLDLVVVSIAADVVPITGENRILAHFGLKRLNLKPRPGFESILYYSNILQTSHPSSETVFSRQIGINDLMFIIGPRINAAGRIENGKTAVSLLLCEEMGETHQLCHSINNNNTERRILDTGITEQAIRRIKRDKNHQNLKTTVIYDPEWSKGVIGIVASRLIDSFYRPTIVFTESNGFITGSARSVKNFDVYNAIDACSHLLEHFGGHMYAAGLSLKPENLEAFKEAFNREVERTITDEMLIPEIEIDAEIDLDIVQGRFFRILKQFEPFGPENHNPVFLTRKCVVKGKPRVLSSKHLKFAVTQEHNRALDFQVIAFQLGHYFEKMVAGNPFDIVYQVEENQWAGKTTLQLNVKDIRFPEEEQ
jgi:single-stranded-DNA-specific exonuclease